MMEPLVSFLISCYNHSAFVGQTLDSIKADSYPNKQIVIIDDGSKDNSVEVIQNWIKDNPKENVQFSYRENKGFCATLNELVDISAGQYLVVVASDDLLTHDTVTERVEVLQKSNKLVLLSDAEVINSDGIVTHKSMLRDFHNAKTEKYATQTGLLDEILFNFAISGAVMMMDRKIFSLTGKFPEDLKGEDFYFYISAAAKNQICFYDRVVSKYRIHDSNTSGENPALHMDALRTYGKLFFKIPGIKRKLRVIKRVAGLIIYKNLAKLKK